MSKSWFFQQTHRLYYLSRGYVSSLPSLSKRASELASCSGGKAVLVALVCAMRSAMAGNASVAPGFSAIAKRAVTRPAGE